MAENMQDIQNKGISPLVRKSPLKARSIQPPKPIRKRRAVIQSHSSTLVEKLPNDNLGVKDAHETLTTSEYHSQRVEDLFPGPSGQDCFHDTSLDKGTEDVAQIFNGQDQFQDTCMDDIKYIDPRRDSHDSLDRDDEVIFSKEVIDLRTDDGQDCFQDIETKPNGQETITDRDVKVIGSTIYGQNHFQDTGLDGDTFDFEISEVHEDVGDNLESKVQRSSGEIAEIFDAPEKNIIDEILALLEKEVAIKGEGSERILSLAKARDILNDTLESSSKDNFAVGSSGAATPKKLLATPGKLANLTEEREKLLEEMLEAIQKVAAIVNNYKTSLHDRVPEDLDEEDWSDEEFEEELERRRREDRGNKYSFPTFLANFMIFSAVILVFIAPAIVFQSPKYTGKSLLLSIANWLNSTVQDIFEEEA